MPGHVVFLECYPHIQGGAQATMSALAVGLPAHGWTTEVVAPSDGPALDALRAEGVPTTVLSAPNALLRYGGTHAVGERIAAAAALPVWTARLARHLRRTGASLLDVADQRGVVLGAPASTVARVRGVWHVHTPGAPSRIDGLGRRWARCRIAPSRGVAARLRGDVEVVAPALPQLDAFDAAPGVEQPMRLVTAGRLHPVKGFDVLIDAVASLVPELADLSLDIYGAPQAGHEQHALDLREQVERLGLTAVVRFHGHQPCLHRQWQGAAAYVQPSREEPFGMALTEAMACGLPVIATRVDGPSEIVDDGRTGLLVPPSSSTALAQAIARLLRAPDLARSLAAAGRQHVRETYTADRLLERTAAVFDRAAA